MAVRGRGWAGACRTRGSEHGHGALRTWARPNHSGSVPPARPHVPPARPATATPTPTRTQDKAVAQPAQLRGAAAKAAWRDLLEVIHGAVKAEDARARLVEAAARLVAEVAQAGGAWGPRGQAAGGACAARPTRLGQSETEAGNKAPGDMPRLEVKGPPLQASTGHRPPAGHLRAHPRRLVMQLGSTWPFGGMAGRRCGGPVPRPKP
jgi:hypothetical protein